MDGTSGAGNWKRSLARLDLFAARFLRVSVTSNPTTIPTSLAVAAATAALHCSTLSAWSFSSSI